MINSTVVSCVCKLENSREILFYKVKGELKGIEKS